MSELQYPEGLRYTEDHEWVKQIDDSTLRVGITAYAQDALGDVVFVSAPVAGDTLEKGEPCGEVESTKSVSDLYAPMDGEVTAVNEELDVDPALVNSDCYGAGWMYEFTPTSAEAFAELMDRGSYMDTLS